MKSTRSSDMTGVLSLGVTSLDRRRATNSSAALRSNEKIHDAQPVRPAERQCFGTPRNDGSSSVNAPAQPHRRTVHHAPLGVIGEASLPGFSTLSQPRPSSTPTSARAEPRRTAARRLLRDPPTPGTPQTSSSTRRPHRIRDSRSTTSSAHRRSSQARQCEGAALATLPERELDTCLVHCSSSERGSPPPPRSGPGGQPGSGQIRCRPYIVEDRYEGVPDLRFP